MKKIDPKELKPKQKETYNFQKLSAVLADYGYNCLWLNDDWLGADFIAVHIDGKTFLKVQLKSRVTVDKKYRGKDIFIAFPEGETWYLYPHDYVDSDLIARGKMKGKGYAKHEARTWSKTPKHLQDLLVKFRL